MKRIISSFALILLAVMMSASVSACSLFEDRDTKERVANLEALIAKLEGANNALSAEYVEQLEERIAELRKELDGSTSEVIADVVKDNINSTVAIQVISTKSLSKDSTSTGSGFFIEYGGYIVTNSHVITPKSGYSLSAIKIFTYDERTGQADLIANLPDIDVAILRCTDSEFAFYKPVKISVQEPEIGSRVIAIGSPSGLSLKFSCTAGVVSYAGRTETTSSDGNVTYHEFCIQHDAAINPGNSGGALFNLAGEVIGINTMGLRQSNDTVYESLGFATEMSAVKLISEGVGRAIEAQKTYEIPNIRATVTDSVLGIIASVPYNYSGKNVAVVAVSSGSQFRKDDIIYEIDGVEINTRQDFYKALFSKDKGDTVAVKYTRSGVKNTKTITL